MSFETSSSPSTDTQQLPSTTTTTTVTEPLDKHALRKLRKEQKQQAKKEKLTQQQLGKEERKELFENRTREKFNKLLEGSNTSAKNEKSIPKLRSLHESSCCDPTQYYKETFWQDPWFGLLQY
ncbi:hypothetical protein C9374_013217 [Naegleria lovaniensis]|uniref:Uncharacterized protein n=1 Tax=Naegleria lovaniensis TaxID=51637 RepID=A0AA88G5T5_NAELO|nr:uncharacterized protein C9374_013217 [Naegleria lovaniensis]KAG2372765.1 hypothetical protein C9374_013217 [Naegleria lovaniensis]